MRLPLFLALVVSIALAAGSGRAEPAADPAVRAAVDKGVAYLKQYFGGQRPEGALPQFGAHGGYEPYQHAMAAIALAEAKVPLTDPMIVEARRRVLELAYHETRTYCLAVGIMLLDRLGHSEDRPVIQFLALRLLAGQKPRGGWTYESVSPVPNSEAERLKSALAEKASVKPERDPKDKSQPLFTGRTHPAVLEHARYLGAAIGPAEPAATPPNAGGPNAAAPNGPEAGAGDAQGLVRGAGKAGQRLQNNPLAPPGAPAAPPPPQQPDSGHAEDNSNTQFATMALWIARRHGIGTDRALRNLEIRYRRTQNPNGSWDYTDMVGGSIGGKPSMTCAGLLGLLVNYGFTTEVRGPGRPKTFRADPQVAAGFTYLATALAGGGRGGPDFDGGTGTGVDYYMLWSVERVCAITGGDKIGPIDWYKLGATLIVRSQGANGAWREKWGEHVDTSFAILFLCKANLARDLTQTLTGRQSPLKPADGGTGAGGSGPGLGGGVPKELPNPLSMPKTTPAARAPAAGGAKAAQELADALAAASPAEFSGLLERYGEAAGAPFEDAMARAAARETGDRQKQIREALAYRLAKAGDPRAGLRAREPEMRRAAALAASLRDEKALIPDLIGLLTDESVPVSRAALASLKSLSGQDFGPAAGASGAQKAAAIAAWRGWWAKQPR